jgi:hypothetical protein
MIEFDFRRTSRKCNVTGRTFAPGEEYISVLLEDEDELTRQDISTDNWNGPGANCLAWWKSKVPTLDNNRVYWAPRDVLHSYFSHVYHQAREPDLLYVAAIVMLQRKQLRLLDTVDNNEGRWMQLVSPSTNERFEVHVIEVAPERIQVIQDELTQKLFTDVAIIDETP